jgi:predicted extracellular nuclease/2',3'-cyclic-nucleotide 2'-phosphodiesterase (5'-nucleotidase family)
MTSTPHVLANGSFLQDWSDLGLITVNDDWSGIPSIEGFRGDDLTLATGIDPQTVLAAGTNTPLDVNANQTNPNSFTMGGVTEFELANPAIALAGSGTADAPFLLIYLDTTNVNGATVKYKLRDLDGSTDDAVQQVALQYRVGNTGNFVNLPTGYVADGSEGGTATKETMVNVILPAEAMNQPLVQLRIITTNAPGSDEWISIDDIEIAATTPSSFDLQITEIWSGNGGSPNLTADWFEVTNVGDAPWVAGVDPDLFYDDDSADPAVADVIQGLTQLAPGERAIAVIGNAAAGAAFADVWGDDADLTGIQIGFTDGAGLGAGGDAVNLWVGHPLAGGVLVDTEAYPDTVGSGGRSYDVELAAFSTEGNGSNAVATTETGGSAGTESAIASPGNQGPANGGVDTTAPIVAALNPADDGTGVTANSNLTIVFNETMQKGSGNITLKRVSDNAVVESIAVSSSAVTIDDRTVTIDPSVTLALGTEFYVEVDAGAFKDSAGNAFAGITDATTWNFETVTTGFLTKIGGYQSSNGAEIPAFDPLSDRLFVVAGPVVEILDLVDPTSPSKIGDLALDVSGDPDGNLVGGFDLIPNSVAVGKAGTVSEGIVAVAIAITEASTENSNLGEVQFFNGATGAFLGKVNVGFLPDMLTFTPDGTKVLTANEGQPNQDYTIDPVGSVSVIDLSSGVGSATVQEASFESFNSQIDTLKAAGVRIFGPGSSVAQDLEPEYITFSGDGTKAWVTLQENNAIAVVDIASATVESIVPLGLKNHNSVSVTNLETFEFQNLPAIGTTTAGQEILLGGFSGLFYEGTAANGNLKFVTHTDRGPNGEPTGSLRPFLLPDFSPEIVRFEVNRSTGAIAITERLNVKQADGTPITGLPNLTVVDGTGNTPYNDEIPVDLFGNTITPLDNLGGDLEGIVVAPDGTFWMVDEYRPALYQFDTEGKLIDRFVPVGTAAAMGQTPGDFGDETLPAVLAQRRQNRGFEAIALDGDSNKLYGFVQSPLRNPDTLSNGTLNGLNNIRIVEFDLASKTVTAEYLYRMDNPNLGTPGNTRPDKIGDAAYIGNGEFLVVERDDDAIDSDPLGNIEKKVYRFSLDGATNITGQNGTFDVGGGVLKSLDQMTPAELSAQGINLVSKILHIDLALAGYNTVEKVEGLTLIDANTIAVLNDNDFQVAGITIDTATGTFTPDPNPEPLVLGIISVNSNGLDASDRDLDGSNSTINIQNQPVFGLYQPDSIASYTVNGQTYFVTANEGDTRDYNGFSEEVRVSSVSYVLDPTAFPNATELKLNQNLGRLTVSNASGDLDGDGDFDQIQVPGSRSFSIWDSAGNLVYDSGDDFEQITAAAFPTFFNASNDNNDFDNRSDNKGPEPEGVTVGTINNRTYAFVGLERIGGVMVYDVTNPTQPDFVQYLNPRDFNLNPESGLTDSGPEGLTFIAASDSPNGKPLLVVGNEISRTTAIFEVNAPVRISDIQGAGHTSPLVGQTVTAVPGIVTAVDSNGFYLQAPNPDADIATSEAVFVFTGSAPTVNVGDSITVSGAVSEFTPGGASSGNLSTTQIGSNPVITVLSSNNPLPAAIILGSGGRELPNQMIDSDPLSVFNPTADGIDFYESLEGMRVTAKNVLAVSPTNGFGEIYGVVDNGVNATGLSQRGTINIAPDDFNPERVQIDEDTGVLDFAFPNVNVGASLGDVTGVIGYNFGNFEIIPTEDFVSQIIPSTLQPEVSTLTPSSDQLLLATYNVLNLDPNDADGDADIANGRFTAIANQIVTNLNAPDIIGLQEVQDNSGSTNDGVISADLTLQTLITAIATAGGPTYAFIDNTFIGNNTSGGQPGANIRTAFLYNPDRVDLVEGSVQTVGSQGNGEAFFDTRLPLIADFTFNGETVTVVNNHFSSKGGSSPLFGVNQPSVGDEANGNGQENPTLNGSLDQRRAQAQVVNDFVDSVLANNGDAQVVVLGDFNEFEFISPLEILAGDVLTNLVETLPDTERYSFIFDGNSQSLDHILVTNNLSTNAQVDIVQLNTEFVDNVQRASDHDPILAQLEFANPISTPFTLELFHLADQEPLNAGAGLTDITGLSAVLNALKAQDLGNDGIADNTLILSSGDAIIPGLFYEASRPVFGSRGIADIQIQNELGVQAIAFGNHEFDFGTKAIADLISGAAPGSILGADFGGTNFPYLSTNLNFATDPNLAPLAIAGGQAPQANKVTPSTVIEVNGEKIGVVGATTPTLASISSPGTVGISPSPFGSTPSAAELDALAAIIQSEVDVLLAANPTMNKVILLSHMQKLNIEEGLATRLENVDIIVGGGSNTRLFDENDRIRPGDSNQGEYPKVFTNGGGTNTLLVNTDGSYKYLGRLVIDFDAAGNILPNSYDPMVSGAYATDAQGVANLNAAGLIDPEIQQIVDAIEAQIIATESNVFGLASVFLNGFRSGAGTADSPDGVRTQETNLGNLTADANLALAQSLDPTVVVSLKNGGGIRASIGQVLVPPGGTEAVRSPNSELVDSQGNVLKPEGGISENDIKTSLAFNNGLTLLTLTKAELVALLEHGVGSLPGAAGQFPQVAGVKFSFDPDLPVGDRLLNAGIFDQNEQLAAELVRDGEIAGDANQEFRIVTLNFLAEPKFDANGNFIGGGDSYPFPNLDDPEVAARTNPVELVQAGVRTGDATFADDGTEQDALAEYLLDNFATNPFDQVDVGPALDERIQNLNFRQDSVLPSEPEAPALPIFGTLGDDQLWAGRDFNGQGDTLFAGGGDDEVDVPTGGAAVGNNRINTGSGEDEIFVGNGDRANGGSGDDFLDASEAASYRLSGGAGNDIFWLGESGRALGGDGDDQFYVLEGGDNLLAGGTGADQFWLLTDKTEAIEMPNIITDFTKGTDVIGIAAQGSGINFTDLFFMGNSIALNSPDDVFAILNGFDTTTLTAADFVFA